MRFLLLGLLLLAAPEEPDVFVPRGFWKPLPPAKRGEWRWRYAEKAQTFLAYKEAGPTRPTAQRKVIYVQPFLTRPPREGRDLDRIAATLEAFFQRKTKRLPARPLPDGVYERKRGQLSVRRLVPDLLKRLPNDALFCLAVTDRDIFVGDLAYAYGWGSLRLRVGIVSTHRLGARPDATRRRRLLTLATHEAAHTLSLPHCTFFQCLMNGARALEEADRRPVLLCPVCRAKLCWNLELDPLARYAALGRAYDSVGLAEAARRTRAAADVTRKPAKG